jgi:O-antigen ligase
VRDRVPRAFHPDAVTFLTFYLVALFAIESRYVIGPLGGPGNPARLIGLVALGWWSYQQIQRPAPTGLGPQPVRRALLVLLFAFAASFVVAMSRPIHPDESSVALLGMVVLLSSIGVALLANDGIPTQARFDVLLGRVVFAASALGLLGVAQFITGDLLIRVVEIPFLRANPPLGDLLSRGGFSRPFGTALHPIEFGAVLAMVLPIAITRARLRPRGGALRAWFAVFAIGLGIVVSGSRSALLCTLAALAVLAVVWPLRTRVMSAVGVVAMLAVVAVTIPGMVGSLVKLFTRFGTDDSVASRTDSYPIVAQFFARDPLLGRGFSTFLPSYRILDNQYLGLLVEVGLVGVLAFLGVLAVAGWCGVSARRTTRDVYAREHGQALAASIAAAALGLAFYDGLNFPMATGMLFLLVGLAGCLLRLTRAAGVARTPEVRRGAV